MLCSKIFIFIPESTATVMSIVQCKSVSPGLFSTSLSFCSTLSKTLFYDFGRLYDVSPTFDSLSILIMATVYLFSLSQLMIMPRLQEMKMLTVLALKMLQLIPTL